MRREELNTPALAGLPHQGISLPVRVRLCARRFMELKAEGQGTTQTFPSASAFLCLCSFGGCRKKLGLGVNEELPGEHKRQEHKDERV